MPNLFRHLLTYDVRLHNDDKERGTLYIGVTNDIERRVAENKSGLVPGFTDTYNLKKLVLLEEYTRAEDAIRREKQLKNWHRPWKINLIEQKNPEWRDLGDPETSSG